MPVSPLPEDLTAELVDILHTWGDRYQMLQGTDDDGWYLRITDRPTVPDGRVVIARCAREARTMLTAMDEGLP
jgi:hypothetical protein